MKFYLYLLFTTTLLFTSANIFATEVTLKERNPPPRWNECQNCHRTKALEYLPQKHKPNLEHKNIQLAHGKKEMSCNFCHNKNNHNFLFKSVGDNDFTHTTFVCQTCHEDVFKSWKAGTHGKRTQGWNKQVQYQCLECHDPHSVSFPKMKAQPPPKRPKFGIPKEHGGEHHEG